MPFFTEGSGGGGASVNPSESIPVKSDDNIGTQGVSSEYSRGDHKHPAQEVSADANQVLKNGSDGLSLLENSDIDHDQTTNFDAKKHVDHTTVSIDAGDGIKSTGLGDITSSRTVSVDVALDADITSQTANKILDATRIIDEDLMTSDSDKHVPTQQSVVAYIANQTAGGVTYRGIMPIPADMTTNTTGNTYADGSSSYLVGDMFVAGSGGVLTLSDGTVNVNQGDALIINTATPDASITVAMVDDIASSNSVQSVHGRTGIVVSANDDYTASQVTNSPSGDISAVNVQSAIDELDSDKVAKDTLTSKGDIFVRNGSNIVRKPVGSNGQVLTANSSDSSGVVWDTLVGNSSGASNYIDIGGVRIAWGKANTSSAGGVNLSVSFPAAFSSTPAIVMTVSEGNYKSGIAYNESTTGFNAATFNNSTNRWLGAEFQWIAVGLK